MATLNEKPVRLLMQDPTSRLGAALQELDFAPTREWLLLADLYDALTQAHCKKPKPYPRPWAEKTSKRIGNTGGRTREQVLSILAQMGHKSAAHALAAETKEAPHG